jgi:hypothetical protein
MYDPLALAISAKILLVPLSDVFSDEFVVCHYYVVLVCLYDSVTIRTTVRNCFYSG